MKDEELDSLHKKVSKRTRVSCCEYHQHSALDDCLSGVEQDIIICKLIEVIRYERRVIREAAKKIGKS